MTDVTLTPEYIATIRDEINALLPEDLRVDDRWRVCIMVDSDGSRLETLYLNAPSAGDPEGGISSVVSAQLAVMDKHPDLYMQVECGITR